MISDFFPFACPPIMLEGPGGELPWQGIIPGALPTGLTLANAVAATRRRITPGLPAAAGSSRRTPC